MIDYFDRNIKFPKQTMVKDILIECGYPDFNKIKEYCKSFEEE